MKNLLFIIGLLALTNSSLAQNTWKFFLDEFQISANRTMLREDYTENGFGYGFGAYHTFRSDKSLNLLLGIEHNRTSQFKDWVYVGRFEDAVDITFKINCISLAFGPRINIGTNTRLFFETGIYLDLVYKSSMSGEWTSCSVVNDSLICNTSQVSKDADLSGTSGLFAGSGVRIPISNTELIISADYRYGIAPMSMYMDELYHRYFRIKLGIRINERQ